MQEPEVPQPITRAEFEAGVKFYHSPKLNPYDYLDVFQKKIDKYYIIDKDENHYCNILSFDDEGFNFIHFIFGHANEFKVFFNNCYKSQNQ